jgi:hypothetical protein
MEDLAGRYDPVELNRIGFRLYVSSDIGFERHGQSRVRTRACLLSQSAQSHQQPIPATTPGVGNGQWLVPLG